MTPHRGAAVPPLAALALPSPTQQSSNILGNMPHQWQASEEMARIWMQAKMEEDRRKAEEERTKQAHSLTETRKLELDLLKEAFRIGIPPPVIPIMFAGGGSLKGVGGEWLNDYYAQQMGHLQQQQQMVQQQQAQQQAHQMPQIHHSPGPDRKLRREPRVINQDSFGPPGQPAQPQHMGPPPGAAGMPPQQGPPPPGYISAYQTPGMPAAPRGGPPMQQLPRPPQSGNLQINTNIHQHQQPPMSSGMPGQMAGTPISTPHGQAMHQEAPAPRPPPPEQGLFFHYWVPPNSQSTGVATPVQATASPQRQLDSPFSHHPPSNQLTAPDYVSSPKKRKAPTAQTQQQTPSTGPFSPPFHSTPLSTATTPGRPRRGHSRHRSETTGSGGRGYEPYSRPTTRQRRSTGGSPHPETNMSGPQLPPVASAGENAAGGGGNGGLHHPREQEHQRQEQQRQEQRQEQQRQEQQRQDQQRQDQQRQDQQRQQSVPPPQQIGRPYSAGPDFRGGSYPPPQPPSSDGGGETKNGNGRN